ncbi:MAG: hypothetical protein KGQ66_13150 [Acidobacteriota bacterium]|nr:hypothetical protein [Acidobacteriota bacterium]
MSAGRSFRRRLQSAAIIEAPIPDAAPERDKQGLAARAVTARTGRCPLCRSKGTHVTEVSPELSLVNFVHKSGCLAADPGLSRYPLSWAVFR